MSRTMPSGESGAGSAGASISAGALSRALARPCGSRERRPRKKCGNADDDERHFRQARNECKAAIAPPAMMQRPTLLGELADRGRYPCLRCWPHG